MNKMVKGTVAAVAGVAILMGGAGSLAHWNATADTEPTAISAGSLSLEAGKGGWDRSLDYVVPGDRLTYTVPLTLTGAGQDLWVDFALADGSVKPVDPKDPADVALAKALTESARIDAGSLTAKNDAYHVGTGSHEVTVSVAVEFPFGEGADNATQDGEVSFSGFGVTATQVATPR